MAGSVKVKRFTESVYLAEIGQDVSTKFALVSPPRDGNRQCHQLVKCRDFLHDAVDAFLNKSSVRIYSFYYKHNENPPVDMARMRMLVKKPDDHSKEKFSEDMALARKLLNHYEEMAGWSKTKMFNVEGEPDFRFFRGPGNWMKAPHMISLYSLLIRLAAREIKFSNDEELQGEFKRIADSGNGNDAIYLRSCRDFLSPIIVNFSQLVKRKAAENYSASSKHSMHDHGGIVSLCSQSRHFDEGLRKRFSQICGKK